MIFIHKGHNPNTDLVTIITPYIEAEKIGVIFYKEKEISFLLNSSQSFFLKMQKHLFDEAHQPQTHYFQVRCLSRDLIALNKRGTLF
jgi:hypothetical protein